MTLAIRANVINIAFVHVGLRKSSGHRLLNETRQNYGYVANRFQPNDSTGISSAVFSH